MEKVLITTHQDAPKLKNKAKNGTRKRNHPVEACKLHRLVDSTIFPNLLGIKFHLSAFINTSRFSSQSKLSYTLFFQVASCYQQQPCPWQQQQGYQGSQSAMQISSMQPPAPQKEELPVAPSLAIKQEPETHATKCFILERDDHADCCRLIHRFEQQRRDYFRRVHFILSQGLVVKS